MSLKLWKIIISFSLLLGSASAFSHHLVFSDNLVRAPIPGLKSTAGFFTVENTSAQDELLVAAQSDIAQRVEFHTHDMVNGQMKMAKLDSVKLPANGTVEFKSGGLHLMFIGLKRVDQPTVDVEFETASGHKFVIVFEVKSILNQHQH